MSDLDVRHVDAINSSAITQCVEGLDGSLINIIVEELEDNVDGKLRQSMYFVCTCYVPEGLLNTLI